MAGNGRGQGAGGSEHGAPDPTHPSKPFVGRGIPEDHGDDGTLGRESDGAGLRDDRATAPDVPLADQRFDLAKAVAAYDQLYRLLRKLAGR